MRDLEASGAWFIGYGVRRWTILSPVELDSLLGLFYVTTGRKFLSVCQLGPFLRSGQKDFSDSWHKWEVVG